MGAKFQKVLLELKGPSKEDLLDLWSAALDSGYYGVGSYGDIVAYHWYLNNDPDQPDLDGFYAVISNREPSDYPGVPKWTRRRIDSKVILRGIKRVLEGGLETGANKQTREEALAMMTGEGAIGDAITADQIIQVGLFGEVVYG